jgi:hypothetical protein
MIQRTLRCNQSGEPVEKPRFHSIHSRHMAQDCSDRNR